MNTITIQDHTYNVQFTMYAAIAFQRLTGINILDPEQATLIDDLENNFRFMYCILMGSNKDEDLPDIDQLMKTIQAKEYIDLRNLCLRSYQDYFKPMVGDKTEAPTDNTGEEVKPKN